MVITFPTLEPPTYKPIIPPAIQPPATPTLPPPAAVVTTEVAEFALKCADIRNQDESALEWVF